MHFPSLPTVEQREWARDNEFMQNLGAEPRYDADGFINSWHMLEDELKNSYVPSVCVRYLRDLHAYWGPTKYDDCHDVYRWVFVYGDRRYTLFPYEVAWFCTAVARGEDPSEVV